MYQKYRVQLEADRAVGARPARGPAVTNAVLGGFGRAFEFALQLRVLLSSGPEAEGLRGQFGPLEGF